ncbi:MAG: DUF951 domain-containing protein [Clostridia bacterium]|nr:DUF951 domain-containing protein [Clostridia bacterium]
MQIEIGDIIEMKKPHPCGSKQFKVRSAGMDLKLECIGCGREVVINRFKAMKNIKNKL